MTEDDAPAGPYRETPWACPSCRTGPMRELLSRLICDHCGGMQLPMDDVETVMAAGPVTYHDAEPTGRGCPRCDRAMVATKLETARDMWMRKRRPVERCLAHGVWFDPRALEREIAVAVPNINGAQGGSAIYSLQPWWHREPRTHLPYRSAFAGRDDLACPDCTGTKLTHRGELWPCTGCGGAFVEHQALLEMMREMRPEPWFLPAPDPAAAPGPRACPACNTPMIVEIIEGTTIDRCVAHGIWFDPGELAHALEHTTKKSWLARLLDGLV